MTKPAEQVTVERDIDDFIYKTAQKLAMEENKTTNKKLSYEELSKVASDLHVQYQKLMDAYQKAVAALNSRDLDYASFFLTMLFKVVENPELYPDDFIKWSIENIMTVLKDFAAGSKTEAGEEAKTDEA